MKKVQKLQMPKFSGARNPDHEKEIPGQFRVIRHNWNWGFHENRPLYPYSFEESFRQTATWFHEKHNRYYLITVVKSGEIRYISNDKTFLLRGNKVLIIPLGTEFRFSSTNRPGYRKLSLFLLGINLPAIAETLNLNQMIMITVPDIDEIIQQMREIDRLIVRQDAVNMPEMSGLALKLLTRLAMYRQGKREKSMIFEMARSRLSANFEQTINIADLARNLNISKSTLERMFKRELKITPREYRIQCIMSYAKDLLLKSDLSIKEISFKLNYCNQFHFSNEFKRICRLTPSQYRKMKNEK